MIAVGNTGSVIIMTFTTILAALFMVFLLKGGRKYQAMVMNLDPGKYIAKDLYVVGLEVLTSIKYPYTSLMDIRMLEYCRIIFGEKYADYYYRIYLTQSISISWLVLILSLSLTVLFDELIFLIFGIGIIIGLVYYFHTSITDIIRDRSNSMTRDFPEVLSKLALLVNAGMIMNEAWEKVSVTGQGVIFQEMSLSIIDMQNGESEIDAYLEFARRCGLNEISKFTSTLVQNLTKGNKELVVFLRLYAQESWESRKHDARRQGEEASSKLLLPIGIMFLGLLIMIAAPIMLSISF